MLVFSIQTIFPFNEKEKQLHSLFACVFKFYFHESAEPNVTRIYLYYIYIYIVSNEAYVKMIKNKLEIFLPVHVCKGSFK